MSTRTKALAVMLGILLLMALLFHPTVRRGEIERSNSSPTVWSIIISLTSIVSMMIVLLLFLSWRDIPSKRKDLYKDRKIVTRMLAFFIMALLFGAVLQILAGGVQPLPRNATANNTTTTTGVVGTPQSYNVTPHHAKGGETSSFPVWIGYTIGVAFLIFLVIWGANYYREMIRRRKRKAIKLKAEAFDRKLQEEGLEAFDNPRDAIVGIYKNAVLWLEYLGIPYKESWTHWEHAEKVGFRRETFIELTRLFEKAKYAPEKVTWEDAEMALKAYREMRRGMDENT
ncbi:conserved hypothetical protein [Thermococcus sp. AM4]|nr:conserved hypothetical protein [Thermococcus sp. AM4]